MSLAKPAPDPDSGIFTASIALEVAALRVSAAVAAADRRRHDRLGSFSKVSARFGEVRSSAACGLCQVDGSGPKTANNGRSAARCDRRSVIAASIRIYALVARRHRLRCDRRPPGSDVRFISEIDALFAATSALAGATFISFNRASYGVRPGEDATGV